MTSRVVKNQMLLLPSKPWSHKLNRLSPTANPLKTCSRNQNTWKNASEVSNMLSPMVKKLLLTSRLGILKTQRLMGKNSLLMLIQFKITAQGEVNLHIMQLTSVMGSWLVLVYLMVHPWPHKGVIFWNVWKKSHIFLSTSKKLMKPSRVDLLTGGNQCLLTTNQQCTLML